jgi:anti-anti-sigma factor
VPFLCECADFDCLGRVEASLFEYQEAHQGGDRYFTLPGHLRIEREEILSENGRYEVVSKALARLGMGGPGLADGNDRLEDRQDGRLRFSEDGASGVAQRLVVLERNGGGVCVLSIEGELDLYAEPVFQRALAAALEDGPTRLVVDLTKCTLIDSTGLGALLKANKRFSDGSNVHIDVACPNSSIRKIFEITALNRIFALHETRAAALDGAGG